MAAARGHGRTEARGDRAGSQCRRRRRPGRHRHRATPRRHNLWHGQQRQARFPEATRLHEAIDYRTKDWTVELERLSQGKGVALITDPLGGNHWKKSYKALCSTGRLGMFGVSLATSSKLSGPLRLLPVALGMPFFHPLALMNTNKSVFGVNLGHMWHESDMIAGWMEILLKGVADGWVRPHVDKSFPLAQVGEAQTYMEERRNIGKVVLTT